jgi:hypothetical protein
MLLVGLAFVLLGASGPTYPPFSPTFGLGAPGAGVPTNQLYIDTTTDPGTMYVFDRNPTSMGWTIVGGGATAVPGGANGNVQYNNAGAFGGLNDAQLTALVDEFTTNAAGTVPAPGTVTHQKYLRDDGTFDVPPISFSPYDNGAIVSPVASGFSLVSSATIVGVPTVTTLATGRGVNFNMPPQSGGLQNTEIVDNSFVPPSTGNFSARALYAVNSDLTQNWIFGLAFTDASGKIAVYGVRNGLGNLNGTIERFCYASISDQSPGSSGFNNVYDAPVNGPFWFQLSRVGSNFVFAISLDGENFVTEATEAVSTCLSGVPVSVGFLQSGNGTPTQNMSVFSWNP